MRRREKFPTSNTITIRRRLPLLINAFQLRKGSMGTALVRLNLLRSFFLRQDLSHPRPGRENNLRVRLVLSDTVAASSAVATIICAMNVCTTNGVAATGAEDQLPPLTAYAQFRSDLRTAHPPCLLIPHRFPSGTMGMHLICFLRICSFYFTCTQTDYEHHPGYSCSYVLKSIVKE
ncbi:hypothetical protein CPB84DRAFT_277705 [Gymnopilus junonius]|uniref:Uncharacterized protein n=1 Tax=Gymnopilus junonius TaxID=109634 RepID=A0A9P5TIT9_GYMJU|nr:hypothetical protein CPB84DRAFT_277705 [Gymnopilus junonius]